VRSFAWDHEGSKETFQLTLAFQSRFSGVVKRATRNEPSFRVVCRDRKLEFGENVLKSKVVAGKSAKRVVDEFFRSSPLSVHQSRTIGLHSMKKESLKWKVVKRSYCSPKEEKKETNEEKKEEVVDADRPASPFARYNNGSQNRQEEVKKETANAEKKTEEQETKVPSGNRFTPTFIITINTEKSPLRRIWRGMGLVSYNFMIAARSWKQKPDGSPVPEFWTKQLYTARLDALLLSISLCAASGPDLTMFILWLVGAIWFPNHLLPSVFRTPSRREVRDFVYDHLRDLDSQEDGLATVADARRVLMVVEREMTPDICEAVLQAAGSDGRYVNYEKLADVVVGTDA
jgi:hypothetical protein